MYNFVFLDDDPKAVRVFLEIFDHASEKLPVCTLKTFTDPYDLLEYCKAKDDIHGAFLDISLIDYSGIDTAKLLLNSNPNMKIIFVTAYQQYAPDIFAIKPTGLLYKPFDEERVFAAFLKLIKETDDEMRNKLILRSNSDIYTVFLRDLIYIESSGRKLYFHEQNRTIVLYGKLSDYEPRLTADFKMCHKSFIVNLNMIRELRSLDITLNNGEHIPVSRNRSTEFKRAFFIGDASRPGIGGDDNSVI